MDLTPVQMALAVLSGGLVGFSLGLVGGGGSVLAVPLLVYLVGVTDPHVAIGTSALAVAVNAAFNLATHLRARTVKLPCSLVFAGFGVAGAAIGSTIGKAVDGSHLLTLFGVIMIAIGMSMALRPAQAGHPEVHLDRASAPRLVPRLAITALLVGMLSGFFGIGGGFLIVPGLVIATGMPLLNAVGSSLVSVTAFGLTTAGNYALSGLVDWSLAGLVIGGGVVGGLGGVASAKRLATRRRALGFAFSAIISVVGVYVILRGLGLV